MKWKVHDDRIGSVIPEVPSSGLGYLWRIPNKPSGGWEDVDPGLWVLRLLAQLPGRGGECDQL